MNGPRFRIRAFLRLACLSAVKLALKPVSINARRETGKEIQLLFRRSADKVDSRRKEGHRKLIARTWDFVDTPTAPMGDRESENKCRR